MRTPSLCLAVSLAACGGGSSSPDASTGRELVVEVDGVAFSATNDVSAADTGSDLSLEGTTIDGRSLTISLVGATASGTFPVGTGASNSIQFTDQTNTWEAGKSGGSASVVITTFATNEVVGTFSGTLPAVGSGSASQLTNGAFDLTFQQD